MRSLLGRFRRPISRSQLEKIGTMVLDGDGSTLSLDFTAMSSLDSRFTFSRSSTTSTYINSSGLVTTAGTNVPRFDYDPTTLAPRGLLIEGSATNIVNWSESFATSGSGTLWNYNTYITRNATQITGPDGGTSAYQFNETTDNQIHRISTSLTGSAGAISISVWAKVLDTNTPRRLYVNAVNYMGAGALFDLDPAVQTGASGSAVATSGTAANRAGTWVKYPNNWYRVTLVGTYVTNQTMYLQINRASSTTATDDTFAGSTSNGLSLWGCQVEQGSGASSYIPTGASQVQRAADSCQLTGTNFSSWFNATQGTFFARGQRRLTSNTGMLLSANDATNSEAMGLGSSTTGRWLIRDGGSDVASISPGTVTANTTYRIAGAYAVNDAQAALNGTLGTADTSMTLPTVNQLDIGRDRVSVYLDGYVELIKYWPTRLPDAQLQAITA